MKNKNIKNWFIIVTVFILFIVGTGLFISSRNENIEIKSVKSAEKLEKIYEGDKISEKKELLINIVGMPFSIFRNGSYNTTSNKTYTTDIFNGSGINPSTIVGPMSSNSNVSSSFESSSSKDYSTTNIQVENVDEADITKTDGNYIYSISEDNVVITDVRNPKEIKVSSKISPNGTIPEDLILNDNQLVVICTAIESSSERYYYSNHNNTIVKIYDITNKESPTILKQYTLYEPYYTSRCINNKLYVIASGNLRKENNKIVTYYSEDWKQKEIGFDNIKYLKDVKTKKQTLISMQDLNDIQKDIKVNSYLMDISNAYVSENNIYLLDEDYKRKNYTPPVSSLFGLWGAIGPFKYKNNEDSFYGTYTKIYKFAILEDGTINYTKSAKIKGKTINQYSIDEYQENLRLALYDNDGSRVVIFDKNLNELGKTSYLARGEKMYSSRFMGEKAYLVTYRTVDPLYVIDLSNTSEPNVLGELKIPGYSTYLHPYDENHLIGIGMETKETINRDSSGRVISTTAKIVGMKMALFDVSDVRNPVQMSSVVIGDSRTTSAILTNPKALLFSKEKELIAIPVNNYAEDFSVTNSSNYIAVINNYTNYQKKYISEGYAVYKINLTEGLKLKGMITHEGIDRYTGYQYIVNSKLLRGIYIDKNLYTISENQIKVNDLNSLELLDEINLKMSK